MAQINKALTSKSNSNPNSNGKINTKKGVVFTLSVMLIALSILYLLVLIPKYNYNVKDHVSMLSGIEKMSLGYDTIASGLKRIETNEAVNISSVGNNISFGIDTGSISTYSEDINHFGKFLNYFGPVNNSINLTDAEKPMFILHPQNISVIFNNTPYSNSSLTIFPMNAEYSEGNINGYTILITSPANTPSINWTEIHEVQNTSPNSIYFHLGFQGSNGGLSDTRYLDRYANNEIHLLNSQNKSMVIISITPPSKLTIEYNLDMYLNVLVGLNNATSVELGNNIIHTTIRTTSEYSTDYKGTNDYNISKIGGVIIHGS